MLRDECLIREGVLGIGAGRLFPACKTADDRCGMVGEQPASDKGILGIEIR